MTPPGTVSWDTPLRGVVGGKAAASLEKDLGLTTAGELLGHYPRRFLDRNQVSSLGELREGELVMLVAQVAGAEQSTYRDRRTSRTAWRTEASARLADGELVWMTFFDRHARAASWRRDQLRAGTTVLVSGKLGRNGYQRGRWELTHPECDFDDPAREESALLPVYPVAGKLRSQQVAAAVRVVLDVLGEVPERLPRSLRAEHGLLTAAQAYRWVHRPDDRAQHGAAVKRLRFDEAFVIQVALAQRRAEQRAVAGHARPGRAGGILDSFDSRLPFTLTDGQQRVAAELDADLAATAPMHRLLQGEVGSGKTVVALRAMLRVVDSGGQAALLAPTEVLAQQHHRSVTAMLGPELSEAGRLGAAEAATRVALLTGSLPAAARRRALLETASGEAGIVIGTHALLEERVQFADLGLVVVDEQHRFGVRQRAALQHKGGVAPHLLVMTATPIPRTVAMTVFGDLETSVLAELPAGRSPIQTTVVPVLDRPAWLERVWQRVREEVEAGRQAYVVCPRITPDEPDEDLDEEAGAGPGTSGPAAVEDLAPTLRDGPLAGLRVASLHGRLTPEEKDDVMLGFAAGEVDVLVATTVIEVGVDVGNATTMVVMDAERFGMSQLHQLRGRVGRGGHPGLCLLVTSADTGAPGRARLDAVASTLDGFRVADLDLQLRKEGDVLGDEQSGGRRTLRLLSVARDADVIEAARAAAATVVAEDPHLEHHPDLRAAVEAVQRAVDIDYLERA